MPKLLEDVNCWRKPNWAVNVRPRSLVPGGSLVDLSGKIPSPIFLLYDHQERSRGVPGAGPLSNNHLWKQNSQLNDPLIGPRVSVLSRMNFLVFFIVFSDVGEKTLNSCVILYKRVEPNSFTQDGAVLLLQLSPAQPSTQLLTNYMMGGCGVGSGAPWRC